MTRLVRQIPRTGPEVEPADHLGYEPHRRGGGSMSSARASAGEDLVALAGFDHEDVELVAEDVDHTGGGAGDGHCRLLSAILPAGLVLAAVLAELAEREGARGAGRPGV